MAELDTQMCKNCIYWRKAFRWIDNDLKEHWSGECHRYPPSTNGHLSFFPKVEKEELCGEFRRIGSKKNEHEQKEKGNDHK